MLLLLVAVGWPPALLAGLDVAPARVSIADGERAAAVMVVNRSRDPVSFRVVVADALDREDGSHELLAQPGDGAHHAAAMIRYSPRQATLDPGERQVVRLQARRPDGLEEGEYRARIAVQTLPRARGPAEDRAADADGGLQLDIQVLYAITLPLAVFHGDPSVEVDIGRARATDDGLEVAVERAGRRSAYGRLTVYAGDSPDGEPLARRSRAVVVVPLERRLFRFADLAVEPGTTLHLVYEGIGERSGEIKASRTLVVE